MIASRHRVLQATHFPWAAVILYAAISVLLFAIARSGAITPLFFYAMGVLALAPILDMRVSTVLIDRENHELVVDRRYWWSVKTTSESHKTEGLTAIVRRHKSWTPGPPLKPNTRFHDRLTLAVFDDGSEVLLFSNTWLATGQHLGQRIALQLGVEYKTEEHGVEERFP